MGAYKKVYLEDANELMRLVFEEVSKDRNNDFSIFVKEFMNCKYRKLLDIGSTRVINMTYDELKTYLYDACSQLFKKGTFSIDSLQAGWIGEMYNYIQFILKKPSQDVYESYPLDKMMRYFVPLHTVSKEVALEKILKNTP